MQSTDSIKPANHSIATAMDADEAWDKLHRASCVLGFMTSVLKQSDEPRDIALICGTVKTAEVLVLEVLGKWHTSTMLNQSKPQ